MRRAGIVGLLSLLLLSMAVPAHAVGKIDLATIVVDELPGYARVAGQGLDGPISKEQFISLSGDPARVRAKLKGRFVRIYARTFVRADGGRAVILAFQFDRPAASKGFVDGVRQSVAAKGPVKPVPGLTNGGRGTQPPTAQIPVPIEQVFFRSGRLGFMLTVTGSQTVPDPSEEAVKLARTQAGRVPHDIASETDIAENVGRTIGYVLAPLILLALVAFLIVRARRRRAPTEPSA